MTELTRAYDTTGTNNNLHAIDSLPAPSEATVSADRIYDAYQGLILARDEMHSKTETTIAMRNILERERAAKIASGEITGRNETERKAAERQILYALIEQLDSAEYAERAARCTYDIAQFDVEMVKQLLRLQEIETYNNANQF